MDAVVIAGGIPKEGDPLYEYTRGAYKALLDIAGKPMIQWVLDALNGAETIDNVTIVGLEEDSNLACPKIVSITPSQGDMVDNVYAGVSKALEHNPQAGHVIMVSSDVPAITYEMIDWLVNTSMESDEDVYYTVIKRQVMEERFPTSKRSYIHFKDMDVCGGDINIIRSSLASGDSEIWHRLMGARKNALKQAALIGFDTLLLLLFRAVTLDQAVDKVARRLNVTGRAMICPYAETGMDVDKPNQLEILRADLAQKSNM